MARIARTVGCWNAATAPATARPITSLLRPVMARGGRLGMTLGASRSRVTDRFAGVTVGEPRAFSPDMPGRTTDPAVLGLLALSLLARSGPELLRGQAELQPMVAAPDTD